MRDERLSSIFLKNDIRGVYGDVLTTDFAYKFAVALSQNLDAKRIVVGSDNRASSPQLVSAIISGLLSRGVEVTPVGIVPTPAIYYITATEDFDLGIIITASHNPKEYNGIKVCDSKGASYSYDNLFSIIKETMLNLHVEQIDQEIPDRNRELVKKYTDFLRSNLVQDSKLNIAVEYGNGTTSLFSEVIRDEEKTELGKDMDANFPRLLPDPAKEKSYVELKKEFTNKKYDMGMIFDTDGDRVGFTDETGAIISPDQISMLFLDFLEKHSSLLIDVKMSKAIRDYANQKGYTVEFTEVGHSKVHENLLHKNFHMAAELSCHYYFNLGYHGFDDGLYAGVKFINIVKQIKNSGSSLSKIVESLPKYRSSKEFRIQCSREKQKIIIDTLKTHAEKNCAEIVDIDGVRCHFEDGWFLVRPSSTEERLSYRVEGVTEDSKEKYLNLINDVINDVINDFVN